MPNFSKCFVRFKFQRLVVVVTWPLPRDGGMAEDHGGPKARQPSRAWTRDCRDRESCQRAIGTEFVAGQCRMR